jgi:hypothetical protein
MEEKDITYNAALEKLIAEEAERCTGNSWLHTKAEAYYATRNSWIALPTIILSTLVGFLSGSSASIFKGEPTIASIGIGCISLFTGVISTVGNFYNFAKLNEGHRIAAIQYAKLGRFLSIELTLPKSERIAAKDVLKITKDNIERLLEISPSIPESIIKRYLEEFKERYPDIAHPDSASGLRKVFINSNPAQPPTRAAPRATPPQVVQSIYAPLDSSAVAV